MLEKGKIKRFLVAFFAIFKSANSQNREDRLYITSIQLFVNLGLKLQVQR